MHSFGNAQKRADLMDINLDIEGQQQEMESRKSAFYGMLSKSSRNLEEVIPSMLLWLNSLRKNMAAWCTMSSKAVVH